MHITLHVLLTLSFILIILFVLSFPLTTSATTLGIILDPLGKSFQLSLHLAMITNQHFFYASNAYYDAHVVAPTLSKVPHFYLYTNTHLVHC